MTHDAASASENLHKPGNHASMALLLHEGLGPVHFDWLLESTQGDDPDEHALLAFRLRTRLDECTHKSQLAATKLPPHRRLYLHYEGPIAHDRGSVTRVATGRCIITQHSKRLLAGYFQFNSKPLFAFTCAPDASASEKSETSAWQLAIEPAY